MAIIQSKKKNPTLVLKNIFNHMKSNLPLFLAETQTTAHLPDVLHHSIEQIVKNLSTF